MRFRHDWRRCGRCCRNVLILQLSCQPPKGPVLKAASRLGPATMSDRGTGCKILRAYLSAMAATRHSKPAPAKVATRIGKCVRTMDPICRPPKDISALDTPTIAAKIKRGTLVALKDNPLMKLSRHRTK